MTEEVVEKKAWHRRPDESAKAFHAFTIYRDMLTKGRSLEKVREKLGKSAGYQPLLERWSSKYNWVSRVAQHDEHVAEVRREATLDAVREMAERQTKQGMQLQGLGIQKFFNIDGSIKREVLQFMDERDAIRAVIEGAKLERIARGEPSEIIKGDVTLRPGRKPLEEYTDEELRWSEEHNKYIEERDADNS